MECKLLPLRRWDTFILGKIKIYTSVHTRILRLTLFYEQLTLEMKEAEFLFRLLLHKILSGPCSESRQAGKVGGRATLFLSVSGAFWQLQWWGLGLLLYCEAQPQPHPGRFGEDLMQCSRPCKTTKMERLEKRKEGFDKEVPMFT